MVAPTLWIEITIAGFEYVAGVVFLFAGIYRVDNLLTFTSTKDLLPYVALGLVALSYISGIASHRIIQVLGRDVLRILEGENFESTLEESLVNSVLIQQRGSARLNREVDFQYGLLALLRSLLFSVPFLGLSAAFWLYRTHEMQIWHFLGPVGVLLIVFWVTLVVAYRRQWRQHQIVKSTATAECRSADCLSGVVHPKQVLAKS